MIVAVAMVEPEWLFEGLVVVALFVWTGVVLWWHPPLHEVIVTVDVVRVM